MEFDWAVWSTPLMVFGGAIAAAAIGLMAFGTKEDAEIGRTGKKADLDEDRAAALQALKDLELEKGKLAPADYERERAALIARGGAAGRALDGAQVETSDGAKVVPAGVPEEVSQLAEFLDKERARLGEESVQAALDLAGFRSRGSDPEVMAPAWKGALSAFAIMGLGALLVYFANTDEVTRRDGAGMTGNQDLNSGQAGPPGEPPWAEMTSNLEKQLQADPTNIEIANELTQLYMSAGDPGKAMEYNRKAFDIDSTDLSARTYKAVLAAMVGMTDRAITSLQEILADDHNHVKALTYLGLILLEGDRAAEAVPILERAVALQPGVQPLQDALNKATMRAGMQPSVAPAGGAEVVLGGKIFFEGDPGDISGREILFVSVKAPEGGPPLAALKLPPGPFPMDFQVTTGHAISMGAEPRPFPEKMLLTVRIDEDGNPMSKDPTEPTVTVTDAKKGSADLKLTLK